MASMSGTFRRLSFAAALMGLTVAVAPQQTHAAEPAATPDKAAIEKIVREYLIKNPEIIAEALTELQRREELAEAQRTSDAIRAHAASLDDKSGNFIFGNPNGDVTVVEFFDYRCGYCKRVMPTLLDEVREDGNVKLVFREFPILGKDSVLAARGAIAAAQQGKYYNMHLALMSERGSFTEAKILEIAEDLGLDPIKLKADMYNKETQAELQKSYATGKAIGLRGTPAFIIGEKLYPGALRRDQLKQLIAEQRRANKKNG